jgi:hypothetical protein
MTLEVKNEEINILDVIERSDLSSEKKAILKKSKIILFPASFSTSHERGNFPSETPNLLKFIRVNYPEIMVDIFENSGEEKIQALHAADIILPPIYFTIQNYTIDLIIGILGAYLYDKLKGIPDADKNRVKSEIFIEDRDKGLTKRINYEGPVSGLKRIEKISDFETDKEQ